MVLALAPFLKGEDARICCIRKCKKSAGAALNKKSNSGTSGNGHGSLEMDQMTNNSPGDDAGKGPGLLAGTIASLLFAFVFGICFLTIMDATRPAGPVVAVSQLVSR